MTQTIIILIISLALVIYGADRLVDGASVIARRLGISEFVIGLTIVGFGTSCPELVVSLTGAIEGINDVAVGNVIGSNIFNTLLILGLTALLMPVAITQANVRKDIPITMFVTLILCAVCMYGRISRVSGIVFLAIFAAYLIYCFKSEDTQVGVPSAVEMGLGKAVVATLLGLLFLIAGGKYFVESSVTLARAIGVSEKFIAITLLAGGTSLPELVTCIIAAAKSRGQMALGNILGSNVFNILLILGCSAIIRPVDCSAIDSVDLAVLFSSMLILMLASIHGKKDFIGRPAGAILLLTYIGYFVYLVINI